MKKRMLFIASMPSEKFHFDGERNKSGDVFSCLKQMNFDIDIIDYTKNKYLQTIKLVWKSMFKKYDIIFISKCVVGGTIALHQILKFGKRSNHKNIYFYLIGNGFEGFDDKKYYKDDLKECQAVIVESLDVVKSLAENGITKTHIFPCVKKEYILNPTQKDYSTNEPLKLIFFSRVIKDKGVLDAIEAVKKLNQDKIKFTLDIAGGYPEEDYAHKIAEEEATKHSFITYFGKTFHISGIESYERLQQYDLHIFPSHFFQECAPGSILDMFIAGVPTLSSLFPNALNVMNERNSYFFEFNNFDDLVAKLDYVYTHKEELNSKRIESNKEAQKYFPATFIKFVENLFNKENV